MTEEHQKLEEAHTVNIDIKSVSSVFAAHAKFRPNDDVQKIIRIETEAMERAVADEVMRSMNRETGKNDAQ